MDDARQGFADMSGDDVASLADEALAAVRKDMLDEGHYGQAK
jgi:hypothetical protein